MRKKLLRSGILLTLGLMLTFNLNSSNAQSEPVIIIDEGGGNKVTCYSTFAIWPFPSIVKNCANCKNMYFVLCADRGECNVPN